MNLGWNRGTYLHRALAILLVMALLLPARLPAQSTPPATTPQDSQDQDKPDNQGKTDKNEKNKDKRKVNDKDKKDTSKTATSSDSVNDIPVSQPDKADVKPGSKADVDAIGNRNVGNGINFYSLEREMALGKSLAQEVERSAKLIDDPVISEYVNRVGQNLVRNSDAKVPFTIKVIDSDAVNAFALPGGFFYVNSGLILRADAESELAGVMAHEIAHVAARHSTKRETKGQLAQLATIPLMILGPAGWAGYGLYQGLNFAIPLTFLKFSRGDEAEADYLGLQYMYKAGYDPNAFVTFFEKIQAEEKRRPGTVPTIFSTHPPTAERVVAVQKTIGTILPARDQYIVTTSEFDTVRERLQRVENRSKLQDQNQKGDRPTLRTRTERQPTTQGQGQGQTTGNNDPAEDPDRPKLGRRDDPDKQQ